MLNRKSHSSNLYKLSTHKAAPGITKLASHRCYPCSTSSSTAGQKILRYHTTTPGESKTKFKWHLVPFILQFVNDVSPKKGKIICLTRGDTGLSSRAATIACVKSLGGSTWIGMTGSFSSRASFDAHPCNTYKLIEMMPTTTYRCQRKIPTMIRKLENSRRTTLKLPKNHNRGGNIDDRCQH